MDERSILIVDKTLRGPDLSTKHHEAVLVTGGRGFIGRRLVQHLVGRENKLIVSADMLPAGPTDDASRVVEIEIDIRDRERLREVFEYFNISTVFDLASITEVRLPRNAYASNIEMTRSIVDCVRQFDVKKYIFYSTQFVFRKAAALPANDRDYYPINAYGESKIDSEELIRSELSQDRWLILRPTYIWGKGNRRFRDGFLYRLANRQLILPTAHDVLRYYGYVDTICAQAATLAALPFDNQASQVFYLSDKPISMKTFCEYFIMALGMGRFWQLPTFSLRVLGSVGDILQSVALPFPINKLQANEMTRDYPVPIERTLAITGTITDYQCAAATVAAWALSDPDFRHKIKT